MSVAEVGRLIQIVQEPAERRGRRLWWSQFRRVHQALAKRCHMERRARQAPLCCSRPLAPIQLAGVSPLTDAQWEQIRLLLPKYASRTRHHASDPRRIIEGIVWVIQTSSSWREVPACFGPWSHVAEHYYRWRKAGKWARILQIVQEQAVPISSSA